MRSKKNRGGLNVGPDVTLNEGQITKGSQAYDDWHWGNRPSKVVDWGDEDFPPMLIECGRLVRLHLRAPEGVQTNRRHPRRKRDTMIEFSRSVSDNSHVAYDPDHPEERLYFLVDPKARPTLARRLFHENHAPPMPLSYLAQLAGGRHSKRQDYPEVMVKPAGVLTALVYFTDKKEDGPSYYIHKMGELSQHFPILASDAQGRLWLAGGNYTCPTPGITD